MGFESEFKFFKKEFKTVKFWSRPIIHDQFYTENLPILGGQKAAVSNSLEGWCAAGNIVQTDGQRDDEDGWRDERIQGRLHFSSRCPTIYNVDSQATTFEGHTIGLLVSKCFNRCFVFMNLMFSILMCHVFGSYVSIWLLVICLFLLDYWSYVYLQYFSFSRFGSQGKRKFSKVEFKRQ